MSDETMTDIDKLAREIADKIRLEIGVNHSAVTAAVKAGILEGMKLQRERDAVIAKTGWVSADYDVVGIADADQSMKLCEHIENAIRSAP